LDYNTKSYSCRAWELAHTSWPRDARFYGDRPASWATYSTTSKGVLEMITARDLDDMDDLFSIPTPVYKLVRNEDPSTSHAAAESLDANRMEQIVLEAIQEFGATGCISDEVLSRLPHYGYSTVTARYKQLKEKGLVKVDDRKRKGRSGRGQLVMWATEFYQGEENG